MPGIAAYSASKAALQTMVEVIGTEVAGFGIRSLVFIPGDMRTPFLASSRDGGGLVPVSDVYKDTAVKHVLDAVMAMHGKQPTDPDKVAKALVQAVDGEILAGREWGMIPLGTDSGGYMEDKAKKLAEEADASREVWSSLGVDE